MNAHFDFWFDQVFNNSNIDFKFCEDFGIGAYAKIRGPLYSFTDNLYGFVEYVTVDVFHHLKEELHHWSLFKYRDADLEWHYCIIYGTLSLLNHHDFATASFQMLNDEFEAKETTFRVGFDRHLKDIHLGDTLIMKVDRLELYLNEAIPEEEFLRNETLYACVNLMDKNYWGYRIRKYEVNDQLFIDYGRNYGSALLSLYGAILTTYSNCAIYLFLLSD
jgi:hypothetical protein